MHLDDQILNRYIDEELTEPWKSQVEEHLAWCPACETRYKEILTVKETMRNAVLDDSAIQASQTRVLKYLDNNVLHKERFSLKKIFSFIPKKILWPALAACMTFCFCLIIFNSGNRQGYIPAPVEPVTSLKIENITPVRSTDNYSTSETLKNYSLEEILQYLDESGYEVEIKVKKITTLPPAGKIMVKESSEPLKILPDPYSNLFKFRAGLSR